MINGNIDEVKNAIDSIHVSELISYAVEALKNGIQIIEGNVNIDHIKSVAANVSSMTSNVSNCVFVIQSIMKLGTIPNKLFMCKYMKICRILAELPEKKRLKFADEIEGMDDKKKEMAASFILNALNNTEEEEKLGTLAKVLIVRLEGKIDDDMYRRWITMVDRTLYNDLLYMRDNLTNDCFLLKNDHEEGLQNGGWINYAGMEVIRFDGGDNIDDSDNNMYKYNGIAKEFCKIIFSVETTDFQKDGSIKYHVVEEESEL